MTFEHPPVVEVALSLQSLPVPNLTTAHFALFWDKVLRVKYPVVQEQPPILTPLDTDDEPTFAPQILFGSQTFGRHWYLSPDQTRLIQLQQDRLVVNWRRLGTDDYPRYDVLRQEFEGVQAAWTAFLREGGFDVIETARVEVTYVNHLPRAGRGPELFSDRVRLHWPTQLGVPTELQMAQTFSSDEVSPRGRLVISTGPALSWNGSPVHSLNLVFRAAGSPSLEECLETMDVGHNQIVNAFSDITSESLKKEWGEQ